MTMNRRWVLASSNSGKLREFRHALSPLLTAQGVELIAQSDLGIAGADEPHDTFTDNALAKARHASRASGCPALADDSGLCVSALGGAPGVRSARYWKDQRDSQGATLRAQLDALPLDEANWRFLLSRLTSASPAQFRAVIVWVQSAEDPHPIVAHGVWNGEVTGEVRGEQGFGYDPIFFDVQLSKMAAELSVHEKQRVSHRGAALRALMDQLALRNRA